MRRLTFVLFAVLLSASSAHAQAKPPEVKHGRTAGDGYQHLVFGGKPDDQGLIWNIQEPVRNGDYWSVSVLNTSDKPISKLCVSIEFLVQGTWYLSGMDNATMWLLPYRLGPYEFAVAVGDILSPTTEDWKDVRLTPCEKSESPTKDSIDLHLGDLAFSGGTLTGTVVNRNQHSVRDILIYYRCVDADGVIYKGDFFSLDIRNLAPDQSEPFEHGSVACKSKDDIIANAVAVART